MEDNKLMSDDMQEDVSSNEAKLEVNVPNGRGLSLKAIPYINSCLIQTSPDHESLKIFHRLLYGTLGHKRSRKIDIGEFHGFEYEKDTQEYSVALKKLEGKSYTNLLLSDFSILLGLPRLAEKKDNARAILNFLVYPQMDANADSISLNRSLSSYTSNEKKKSSRHKNSDIPHEKRIMNPYMRYANACREAIMKENPTYTVTDIGRLMGQLWKKMTDEDKAPYVNAYNEEKEIQKNKKMEMNDKQ
ncbi:hypothetical protein WA158_002393 [Blastocystis sp. Blastoise]